MWLTARIPFVGEAFYFAVANWELFYAGVKSYGCFDGLRFACGRFWLLRVRNAGSIINRAGHAPLAALGRGI